MNNQKIFKKILQGLFFLALISPLIVDRKLFFPYVTGSALYFRLIVEALFLLWIIFVLAYPKFRPKLNILISAIGIYILALTAATVFSVNPYLSFWGDAERMMGLFGILHFFALFLVGASIFRDKKELRILLNVFVGISLIVCVYGILQRFGLTSIKPGEVRIVATVGNAGILAAYLIFGLFLSAYLALKNSRPIYIIIYGASALIHLIAIFLTGTRGAFLGVAAGFLVAVLIIIFSLKDKKRLRKSLAIGIVLLAVSYGFLFINQDKNWIKNNSYLYRLTHFSLQDTTAKTRLMSWKWGLSGFKEKPLLGYGLEQYAIPYNKYFEAEYYNYAASKPYFDRAHNIAVELLATTGAVGLISYLLIFTAIFYYLIQYYKDKKDYIYLGVIGGLAVAYFAQNLLIFDMLPAMLGFMVLLIFINNTKSEDNIDENNKIGLNIKLTIPIALILLVCFYYSINKFIFMPYKALRANVAGQVYMPHDHNKAIQALHESVGYNTYIDLDNRSSAANTIFNYYFEGGNNHKDKKQDLDFAIELYKDNLKYLPDDTYYNYKTAEFMDYRFAVDLDEKILTEARKHIDKAISTSPNRARLYYILAENLLMSGELGQAAETVEKAISLNDKFGESYWELTKVLFSANKYSEAKESLIKTVESGYHISEESLMMLRGLFDIEKSIENEIEFLELIIKNGTKNYLYYSTLANKYYEAGNMEKAIYYAQRAAALNPGIREDVDKFIIKANKKD